MAKFGAIEFFNEFVDDAAYFLADPGDDVFDTFSNIDPDEPRNEVNGKRNGLTQSRFDTRSQLANTLIQFSKSLVDGACDACGAYARRIGLSHSWECYN